MTSPIRLVSLKETSKCKLTSPIIDEKLQASKVEALKSAKTKILEFSKFSAGERFRMVKILTGSTRTALSAVFMPKKAFKKLEKLFLQKTEEGVSYAMRPLTKKEEKVMRSALSPKTAADRERILAANHAVIEGNRLVIYHWSSRGDDPVKMDCAEGYAIPLKALRLRPSFVKSFFEDEKSDYSDSENCSDDSLTSNSSISIPAYEKSEMIYLPLPGKDVSGISWYKERGKSKEKISATAPKRQEDFYFPLPFDMMENSQGSKGKF